MNALNPNHPMSQFAEQHAIKFIACMIWKLRKHCPNLQVELTDQDMTELANVFEANGRRGIVSCTGRSRSVVLQLIDQDTGKALQADRTLDENSPNAKTMARMVEARRRAAAVANRLRHDSDVGEVGKALAYEAAEILDLLVWEPKE